MIENLGFKRFSMSPWNAFFSTVRLSRVPNPDLTDHNNGLSGHRCQMVCASGYLSARTLHQGVSRQTACREFRAGKGRTPPGFQGPVFPGTGSRSAQLYLRPFHAGGYRRPEDIQAADSALCDASAKRREPDYDRARVPDAQFYCRGRQYRRTGDFPFARRGRVVERRQGED